MTNQIHSRFLCSILVCAVQLSDVQAQDELASGAAIWSSEAEALSPIYPEPILGSPEVSEGEHALPIHEFSEAYSPIYQEPIATPPEVSSEEHFLPLHSTIEIPVEDATTTLTLSETTDLFTLFSLAPARFVCECDCQTDAGDILSTSNPHNADNIIYEFTVPPTFTDCRTLSNRPCRGYTNTNARARGTVNCPNRDPVGVPGSGI